MKFVNFLFTSLVTLLGLLQCTGSAKSGKKGVLAYVDACSDYDSKLPVRVEQFVVENGFPEVGHRVEIRIVGVSDKTFFPGDLEAVIAFDDVPLHELTIPFCSMKYSGSIKAQELPPDVPPPQSVINQQVEKMKEEYKKQIEAKDIREQERRSLPNPSTKTNTGRHLLSYHSCKVQPGLFYVESAFDLPQQMFRGNYNIVLKGYDNNKHLVLCSHVKQMVRYGSPVTKLHDYTQAVVAFAVAGASSYYLAQLFPFLSQGMLPLITGYLGIGIIVGPFVTHLITAYDVHLLSDYINEFALAFIASSAGCEIYFPELRGLVRPILLQIAFMTITTFLVVGVGIYMMTPVVPILSEQATPDCRISIALLLSSIMLARSPATAVAIISELGAKSASSKVMLGITVVSDVVVLVCFDIIVGVTQVTCGNEHNHGVPKTFDANHLYFLLSEIGGSVVIGVLVGMLIRFYLWLPFSRFIIPCPGCRIRVYRSQLKALFILPTLLLTFEFSRFFAGFTAQHLNRSIKLEPLLLCIVAGCVAGHDAKQRRKFGNILEKVAPAVFLPFFVLTGASLQLDDVHHIAFVATCVCGLRLVAIFSGSTSSAIVQRICGMHNTRSEIKYMWLTLLSQAGVALGLAISAKEQFPAWGSRFETLVISVVVINQILGPVLCKIGMMRMEDVSSSRKKRTLKLEFETIGGGDDDNRQKRRSPTSRLRDETSRFLRSNTVDELDSTTLVDIGDDDDAVDKEEMTRLLPQNDKDMERDVNELLEKHGYGSLSQLTSRLNRRENSSSNSTKLTTGSSNISKKNIGRSAIKRSKSSGLFFRDTFPDSPSDSEYGG